LPPAQRALWPELAATPPEFTLYGGTAIALQLGHRQSVDFDFWSLRRFDARRLLDETPFLRNVVVTQNLPDTLTVRLERNGAPILLSFFSLPKLGVVEPTKTAPDIDLKVASLVDLAGCKAFVVQHRAELKDYLDVDALLRADISLAQALSAATIVHGPRFNPQLTLKALCYFEDGTVAKLDSAARRRLTTAVRSVDCARLPKLKAVRIHGGGDAS
jgi:hypothetical protein